MEDPAARVPEGEGVLTVETGQAFRPEFLVKVEDDLGIGVRCKLVPASFEFGAQLHIIKHLAIEDDPECAVLIADGLLAARKVDDAQAGISQADTIGEINAELVRPAMADHAKHAPKGVFGRGI